MKNKISTNNNQKFKKIEPDKTKLPVEKNTQILLDYVKKILDKILSSVDSVPTFVFIFIS